MDVKDTTNQSNGILIPESQSEIVMTYPTPSAYLTGEKQQQLIESEFFSFISEEDKIEIAKKNNIFDQLTKDISCELGKVSFAVLFSF